MNLYLEAVNDDGDNVSDFRYLWQTPTDITYRIYRLNHLNTEGKPQIEKFFLQLEEYEKWVTEIATRHESKDIAQLTLERVVHPHINEIKEWVERMINNGFTPEFYYL